MVGIDTNVLVRFLMNDDKDQAKRARAFIATLSSTQRGFISFVVIAELTWVLQYIFQLPRQELLGVLTTLLKMPVLQLENRSVFLTALRRSNTSSAGFVDCLISSVAERAGCTDVVTFDRKAAKASGMQCLD